MAVIKRASIPSGTLKLKRQKNDRKDVSSNRYKYVVEYPDGDQTSPRFTKQKAMTEFNRVKANRQQTKSSSSSSKTEKAKGILGSLGFGSSKGGGEKVVDDIESGNFDPLGLDDESGMSGGGGDELGMDGLGMGEYERGEDSVADLDKDLAHARNRRKGDDDDSLDMDLSGFD